jgi:hypothetical protein
VAAAAESTTVTSTSEGTLGGQRSQWLGFCQIQWVNSTPPLSSYNRFTCLEVDTLIEPHICVASGTEVMQTHSHPPIVKGTTKNLSPT